MSSGTRLPAAQYLRMSTEHQQYSIDNQADAIRRYAEAKGFEIIKTYIDEAKSGLVLKRRLGLAKLLSDVVGGPQPYKAIMVYDVSRWGRFQDADESAYYEFLCKSAGFEPIVDEHTFTAAQQIIAHSKSDEYLLDRLRFLLATEGSLGRWELRTTPGMPSEQTYVNRFGSLTKAFALAGFERHDRAKVYQTVHRIKRLRSEVVENLLDRFPNRVRLQQETQDRRPILHFDGAPPLLIVVCKSVTLPKGGQRWILSAHIKWAHPALLCLCNQTNTKIEKFSLFRSLPPSKLLFRKDDFNPLRCRSATDVCSLFETAGALA